MRQAGSEYQSLATCKHFLRSICSYLYAVWDWNKLSCVQFVVKKIEARKFISYKVTVTRIDPGIESVSRRIRCIFVVKWVKNFVNEVWLYKDSSKQNKLLKSLLLFTSSISYYNRIFHLRTKTNYHKNGKYCLLIIK